MTDRQDGPTSEQVYKSFDEFQSRFYGSKNAENERTVASASFGRNLAKEIVDKASREKFESAD